MPRSFANRTLMTFLVVPALALADAPYETVFVPADISDGWESGCYLGDGDVGSFVIYVPIGSSCGDSDESLSISFLDSDLPLERSSLRARYDLRSQSSDFDCAVLTIVDEKESELMWEEDFSNCPGRLMFALTKVLLGKDGLHAVTYSNFGVILSEKKKMRWTQYLLNAYVEKDRQRVYVDD